MCAAKFTPVTWGAGRTRKPRNRAVGTSADRRALLARGGSTHTERQMAVTLGTMPTVACFDLRRADAARMRAATLLPGPSHRGGEAALTDVVILGAVTHASSVIALGDALWQVVPGNGPTSDLLGSDLVEVFSSFAGIAGKLPPGYAVRVRTHPTSSGATAVDGYGVRKLVGAVVRVGGPGVDDDELPDADDETLEVLQEAFAGVAHGLRFVGVALGSYRVGGNAPGGGEGVTAMVRGRVTLTNTSSVVLLPGMLIKWEMPNARDVLRRNPMVQVADPRAHMAVYDKQQHMRKSLLASVKSLLGSRDADAPSPFVQWASTRAELDPFGGEKSVFQDPKDGEQIHTGSDKDARERETKAAPKRSKDALVLVHLVEAAIRLGVQLERANAVGHNVPDPLIVVDVANDIRTNYMRGLMGKLLGVDHFMGDGAKIRPPFVDENDAPYKAAADGLGETLEAFVDAMPEMANTKHGWGPFARVLRAGSPLCPVDVLLL